MSRALSGSRHGSRARGGLPPGPRSTLLSTYQIVTDPYGSLPRWLSRYGDPFTVPLLGGDLVITASPENIKQIYAADAEMFDVAEAESLGPLLGEHSVMLIDGARHQRARKLLSPPFHGSRVRAYGQTIARLASAHAARLRAGTTVDMLVVAQNLALEVILHVVFGVTEPERVKSFREAIANLTEAAHPAFLFAPVLQREFGGIGPYARYRRAAEVFDRLLFDHIRRSRADVASREDILSLLLAARHEDGSAMGEAELHDQLLTLVVAGHEPTSISLAWAFYWIHRTRGVLDRVTAELGTLGDDPDPMALSRLPYLNAVISEAMRVHPVVPYTSRRLRRPFELSGYTIPAGASVAPATALVHMREEVFSDPRAFTPERFLDRRYSSVEYIPFSGGERRCLGAAFATFEMAVVLGTILRETRLELADGHPIRPCRRNLLMGPRGGVPMRLRSSRRA